MAYTPPPYNAVNVDLNPIGSAAVVLPAFNAVNVDLAIDSGDGGGGGGPEVSDNARLRNFAILLAI